MRSARSVISHAGRIFAIIIVAIALCATPTPAHAWDSRTHKLIARLALDALPESPLKRIFEAHATDLQEDAVAPDEVLRPRYGKDEAIRHYIDLENFGADPFAALQPDFTAMISEYGAETLWSSGILPWTIAATAQGVQQAWRKGDCVEAILLSGYLAHYVGDATQPLHTTKFYDGYPEDRGMHARLEGAADHSVREIEELARAHVHIEQINSVWLSAIGELRHSNALVATTFDADRAARAETGAKRGGDFDRALMRRDLPMIVRQVAEAASVLASIWLYEWKQAGSPSACTR
jgi:zinc dependent phospholipase C